MYRVIWQYAPGVIGDFDRHSIRSPIEIAAATPSLFSDLTLPTPIEPVFPGPPMRLRNAALKHTPWVREEHSQDLAGYAHTFVSDRNTAELLVSRLTEDFGGVVLAAEIQPELESAVLFSPPRRSARRLHYVPASPTADDDLRAYQGYLLGATDGGIDAYSAWAQAGGRGSGIAIVDIEFGWNFQHQDLRSLQGGVIYGPSLDSDHGTGALGIFSADSNGFGIEGIACEAIALAGSADEYTIFHPLTGLPLKRWNAARSIYMIARKLPAGNVILLEMHGAGPNASGRGCQGYLPVEFWRAERAAIQFAVAKGAYVVEAGGNGCENLDDVSYCGWFDRDRCDSGAILVGGGVPPSQDRPRSRAIWSNYGSRFDIQAWGEEIATTGGADWNDLVKDADPNRCYTESYGGTSGASAIVAGAVACVAGVRLASGKNPLPPKEMRQLLIDTGSLQVDSKLVLASDEHIGPQPDLRIALATLPMLSRSNAKPLSESPDSQLSEGRNAMASTHVHVILSGIVSLIPDTNTPPKSWTVRLHDARSHPHHAHVPSIVVEHDNSSSSSAPDRSQKSPSGTLLDAWFLDNGVIKVNSTILSLAISSPYPLPFVLTIEGACGGVADCPIAKTYDGVTARVEQGSLETTELEPEQWQWKASSAAPVWIAEEVCWHFEIDGTTLELELPHKGTTLKLNINAPTGGTPTKGGDIELRLQNMREQDVFPIFGTKPSIDPHSGLYFDQSTAQPSPIPVLEQATPTGTQPALPDHMHRLTDTKIGTIDPGPSLRVNCPPAQWKG